MPGPSNAAPGYQQLPATAFPQPIPRQLQHTAIFEANTAAGAASGPVPVAPANSKPLPMSQPSSPPLSGGSTSSIGDPAIFGVVTVSDRASSGVYEDLSGPAILQFFQEAVGSPWTAQYVVIPDEQPVIEATLKDLADNKGCCLIVTTGGTGPSPRDVTPEATEAVCSRMLPGYGEQMRAISLKYVPTAVLSRQTAGMRGKTLIINLPGKPKSIRETFDEVFRSIPYCIQLMEGPYVETHEAVVAAFRPPADRRSSKPADS